jgi:hypothetical protein
MADSRKADLIAQLDRARSQAAANSRALGDDLQVGDKLKENIDRHRGAWLSGALLTGLVISKLPARKETVVLNNGRPNRKATKELEKVGILSLVLSAVKFAFSVVRPFALKWLTKRFTEGRYLRPAEPRYSPRY